MGLDRADAEVGLAGDLLVRVPERDQAQGLGRRPERPPLAGQAADEPVAHPGSDRPVEPGDSTQTLSFYIWRIAFQDLDIGKPAAASHAFFFVIGLLVLLLMRLLPDATPGSEARRA